MKISIVGAGYVGLVTGLCLAEKGHRVICVDNDVDKVEAMRKGTVPIFEKDLDCLHEKNNGRNFMVTADLYTSVLETEVTFIAVGTPYNGSSIDLGYIEQCATDVGLALRHKTGYHLVIVKSTVVPGTTDGVVLPILEKSSGKNAGAQFGVGMNPEFMREGEAVNDFMRPDRIVLGALDERSLEVMEEVYRPFGDVDKLKTNTRTAEMIKYVANCFFATLISFSNEIANLCQSYAGVDIVNVMNGVKLDNRLSPITDSGERILPAFTSYMDAGCGFGGSCFPKDIKALISHGKQAGCATRILEAVTAVNERQPLRVISILKEEFPDIKGLRISVLGLAFKPGTDDVRESPAIKVIEELNNSGALVRAYDPVATARAKEVIGDIPVQFYDELDETINDADAILVMTRWDEFKKLPEYLMHLDDPPLVIDARRMLDKTCIKKYRGVGLYDESLFQAGGVYGGPSEREGHIMTR